MRGGALRLTTKSFAAPYLSSPLPWDDDVPPKGTEKALPEGVESKDLFEEG